MTYAEYRLELIATAEAWERAIDTAKKAERPDLVRLYGSHAARCRVLAEPDPEIAQLFETESAR